MEDTAKHIANTVKTANTTKGKNMEKFTVKTRYGTYENCELEVGRYHSNGHIAYEIIHEDGPLACLTVNVDKIEFFPKNYSCVDINNFPEAETVIRELNLGTPTGYEIPSGFCIYPVYKFNIEEE